MLRNGYTGRLLIVLLSLTASCGSRLTDEKVEELVRLHYRQQSLEEDAGKWQPDNIAVLVREPLPQPDHAYRVQAFVTGYYVYPVLEGSPSSLRDRFADSLEFMAIRSGKKWLAKRFEVTHSLTE